MLYSILNSNSTRRVMAPKRKGRTPRNESRMKARFRQSVYNLWKENKEALGFGNRANSEFGEIVIHRISTLTPQSASNASKWRRSETDVNHSPAAVASKLFFHSTSRFKGIFYLWKIVKDNTKLLLYFQSGSFWLVETNHNKQSAVNHGK